MTSQYKISRVLIIKVIIVIYYAVGVAGLTIPATQPIFQNLVPLTLISSLVVLLWFHSKWERHHVWVFLLIAVLGFLVEVVGIATGLVFGEYEYGHALGFELLGTPPIIGLNWLLLIYCVYGMLENYKLHVAVKTIVGATLMVLFDVALEPVAMALEMWNWEGNVVPLQNYAAWFVISLAFLSIMNIAKIKTNNPLAAFLFFVQFAFFISLNILL